MKVFKNGGRCKIICIEDGVKWAGKKIWKKGTVFAGTVPLQILSERSESKDNPNHSERSESKDIFNHNTNPESKQVERIIPTTIHPPQSKRPQQQSVIIPAMDITKINGVSIFQIQSLTNDGFIHGCTSRLNDDLPSPVFPAKINSLDKSVVLEFAKRLGLGNHKLVFQKQIHSDNITLIKKENLKEQITIIQDNDGLITNESGVCLISHSADCLSLMLAHVESGVIANAHCGRKGAILNLPVKLIVTMCREFGLIPTDIIAFLGTSIAASCYEVGDDVVQDLIKTDPTALGFLLRKKEKRFFDLRGYVFYQLTSIGVSPKNIHSQPLCSHCHEELFYSYRRDGKVLGSQIAFIGKRS